MKELLSPDFAREIMTDSESFQRLKDEIVRFKPVLDGQMVSHVADELSDENLQVKVGLAGLWLAKNQDKDITRLLWGTPVAREALSRVIALAGALDWVLVEQEILKEFSLLCFRGREHQQS